MNGKSQVATDVELTRRVRVALCLAYCGRSKNGKAIHHAPICKRFERWRLSRLRVHLVGSPSSAAALREGA